MIEPPTPEDEADRQAALDYSHLLQANPAPFDTLTTLARSMFGVPIALVSIVSNQEQVFLSHNGIEAERSPRHTSFCGHVLLEPDILVIADALKDLRFKDNPFVVDAPNVRFYAGVPIHVRGEDGRLYVAGSFCVIDNEPRSFGPHQQDQLKLLAKAVEREIELTQQVTRDALTGLLNRQGLMQVGQQTFESCRRQFVPLTCIYFDLNGLKAINTKGGHKLGDEAIVGFGHCLKSVSRKADCVAHVSGDEYVILMAKSTKDGAKELCDRLDKALLKYNSADRGYILGYEAGIATLKPRQSLHDLISEADKLMLAEKEQKKAS